MGPKHKYVGACLYLEQTQGAPSDMSRAQPKPRFNLTSKLVSTNFVTPFSKKQNPSDYC